MYRHKDDVNEDNKESITLQLDYSPLLNFLAIFFYLLYWNFSKTLNRKLPVNYGFEDFYDPQEKLC